jgi:hypothetical protein
MCFSLTAYLAPANYARREPIFNTERPFPMKMMRFPLAATGQLALNAAAVG